jgi:hypothetical protein
MRVRAKAPMYYSRRMYAVGDEYEMDDREHGEAKILSVLGKIDVIQAAPAYQATAMKAEPEPEPEPVPAAPMTTEDDALTGKRIYRRRDMRAQR